MVFRVEMEDNLVSRLCKLQEQLTVGGLGRGQRTYDGFRGVEKFALSPDLNIDNTSKGCGKESQAQCGKRSDHCCRDGKGGIFSENKGGNGGLAYHKERERRKERDDWSQVGEPFLYIQETLATEAFVMEQM